jgi:hypothetical protein
MLMRQLVVVQGHLLATELAIQSLGSSVKLNPDLSRIESTYACLRVIKAWYDIYFALPLIEVAGAPFFVYAELGQTVSALYRLATSEDPEWDKGLVYKEANVLVVLEQVTQRLYEVGSVFPMEADGEDVPFYERIAKIVRGIKASWEPALNQQMGDMLPPNSNSSSQAVPNNVAQGMAMAPDPYSMDMNEIPWMSDVFGPWEF